MACEDRWPSGRPSGTGQKAMLQNNERSAIWTRSSGTAAPLVARLVRENFVSAPVPPMTQRLPVASNARPTGTDRDAPFGVIRTLGTGDPVRLSCVGLNEASVRPPMFATHRFPDASNASPPGL